MTTGPAASLARNLGRGLADRAARRPSRAAVRLVEVVTRRRRRVTPTTPAVFTP